MITFLISIAVLIAGYFLYGKIIEKLFGIDPQRKTPALTKYDGVDYVPLKPWRIFMIQFLNIAGLGPIFGAIMGAKFGTSSFLWIVFGTIFAGAVHDYLSGMISLRMGGASLPEIHGKYLGNNIKQFMRVFMVVLMILVGVVFVIGPAGLLAKLTPSVMNETFWIIVILAYYILATLLPIDKLIGKVYPLFGFCLLFMAISILFSFFFQHVSLPEIWEDWGNKHPQAASNPIFPMMFISIACGAISGFHATQSPLMARTMTNERQGRPIFYGAMVTEGIVALIWAATASYFFFNTEQGKEIFVGGTNAAIVVDTISKEWLGTFGAILALLGVIAAPITSGDTAFRSARLIISDFMNFDQKPILKRLIIAVPLFLVAFGVLFYSLKDSEGFDLIWRYFAWANQTLATFTLWAVTIYLVKEKKNYLLTLIPALFMTMVCSTFLLIAEKEGFGLGNTLSYSIGGGITLVVFFLFLRWKRKNPA
ncbi:MAG: carbon starvation protein A [Dysgonamonadaceae bacterium]|jgi:carbon starvation protein CstA|nr:carbon starvation protein A [Dysgonamonadaceae bacterium]